MSTNGKESGAVINGIRADLPTHVANLSAHTRHLQQVIVVGQYMDSWIGTSTNAVLAVNTLYVSPCLVPRNMTFDRIAIDVKTADAGQDIRLGIYADDGAGYPDLAAPILDAGTVDTDSAVVKTITINQALTKGLYWLASITDSNGVVDVYQQVVLGSPVGVRGTGFEAQLAGYSKAQAYGALPTFPSGATAKTYNTPRILLRVASLD